MSEVDFSQYDEATDWFLEQNREVRATMSCRAALRVLCSYRIGSSMPLDNLDMAVFRACLTAATGGLGRYEDIDWSDAAKRAALFAQPAVSASSSVSLSAASSATCAAEAADPSRLYGDSAACAIADAANAADPSVRCLRTAAASTARSATFSAVSWDSDHLNILFSSKLWSGADVPTMILTNHEALLEKLRHDPAWAFWLQFYVGMWNGTFAEWDLAFKVIQIEEMDWEAGFEHVGDLISEISA